MSYNYVLKNGYLVDPLNNVQGFIDIGISGGKIAAVEPEIEDGQEVIDLQGQMIMPGVIDIHTHMTRLLGGTIGYKMMAQTGVTTAIDFAGPISDVLDNLEARGCGLNVGGLEGMIPQLDGFRLATNNPTPAQIEEIVEASLEDGALGIKLIGGHYPLTPEATEASMRLANKHLAMVAYHAGTTATKSDMTGMREAFELARGKRILLAHINAYCRGNVAHPLDELKEAFQLIKEHDNVYTESHLAVINGTSGYCSNGIPKSGVTQMSLKRLGYDVSETGLEQAIRDRVAQVHKLVGGVNQLVSGEEGVRYWKKQSTNTGASFPMNLPTIAVGCVVERVKPGGDFVIDITSTDGGGIPRNNLIGRMFALYHLGYLSLQEIVLKISLNPAKMFGLTNKGHLGIGADADITVVDISRSRASMSFVGGKLIMKDGVVVGKGGQLLVTQRGVKAAKKAGLAYQICDLEKSTLYSGAKVKL